MRRAGGNRAAQGVEAEVRAGKSPYLRKIPIPYPKTDDEIVDDFLVQFRDFSKLNLRAGYRHEITRVTSWKASRCEAWESETLFLVRAFDARSGEEVARGVVRGSGYLEDYAYANHVLPWHFVRYPTPTFDQARETLARFHVKADDPQYIAWDGHSDTTECAALFPCVAFRNEQGSWFVLGPNLFFLPTGAEWLDFRRRVAIPPLHVLVSIGRYKAVAAAVFVDPYPPPVTIPYKP